MLGVGHRALGIEPATPEIDHLNAAVIGGHTRAEFFSVRKVGSKCFAYWFPAGSNGSDDVGHAANIVRLAQCAFARCLIAVYRRGAHEELNHLTLKRGDTHRVGGLNDCFALCAIYRKGSGDQDHALSTISRNVSMV